MKLSFKTIKFIGSLLIVSFFFYLTFHYFEEESIGMVIRSIPRGFHDKVDVKVLVIDDGSSDRTVEVSNKAGADYLVSFPTNQGLGAAVRAGLRECFERGADVGVMIDADGEYPAEYIPNLLQPIFQGEADYAMGSRFLGTIKGMKLYRRLGNYCFPYFLLSLCYGLPSKIPFASIGERK